MLAMQVSQPSFPPTTRTRRSGSGAAVGYHRPNAMDITCVQPDVAGLKMFASGSPTKLAIWPPTTRTRPSDSMQCPAQKMLSGGFLLVKVFVEGRQTNAAPC